MPSKSGGRQYDKRNRSRPDNDPSVNGYIRLKMDMNLIFNWFGGGVSFAAFVWWG